MKAVITRDMKVMNDKGEVAHFAPSTPDNPFIEVSPTVYGRLLRAGAAHPYQPKVESETLKPETKKKSKKP